VSDDPADTLFTTPEMAAIWSAESGVRRMLAFEAALARAEARAGIMSDEAAQAIADACRVELFDVASIYRTGAIAGTPAIPLVHMLSARVAGAGRGLVHWGATSQDVLDTAMVLQAREGLDLLSRRLLDVGGTCAELAERHASTLMAGRTLLQQAVPITFGLKAARWLALVTRQVRRLGELHCRISVVQLGGAAGTLAALGSEGPRVVEMLAEELGLAVPDLPWHAERDRVAEVGVGLGVATGAMAKIATDLVLLAQTEAGEVAPAATPHKGGSSAMPQKRNSVDATMALAAARMAFGTVPVLLGAMAQEHERAVGGWQAEWASLPDLFRHTAAAVERVRDALDGLEVNVERMRANLARSGGQIMAEALSVALAREVGRDEAHRLVHEVSERARAEGTGLRVAALHDQRVRETLPAQTLERTFDPATYLGSTDAFIQRALDGFRALRLDYQGGEAHGSQTAGG
jgi:3-carboxy-cis,cis-muconate cycloisomerase